jgi:hypothetical protein
VSPEENTRWNRAEAFPRQLQGVRHRVGYEVIGNECGVTLWLACHPEDIAVVKTAFLSTYSESQLSVAVADPLQVVCASAWDGLVFFDLCAPTIYSRRFTEPEGLPVTPLAAVLKAMTGIQSPALGIFQLLFKPTAHGHDWHRNIAALHDYEFLVRVLRGIHPLLRTHQQLPSADERMLAEKLDLKASNDTGIYATAIRFGIVGGGAESATVLRALDVFSGLIQQGGRPMEHATRADYAHLSPQELRDMFNLGLTYRPGFLANASELTSILHLPPADVSDCHHKGGLAFLEPLRARVDLSEGSYIGDFQDAGTTRPVCIPLQDRFLSVHMVGKPGRGKTEVLKHIILGDILRGAGVVVLDPHGDLIQDMMDLIPPAHAQRTILLDWSNPEMIPIFNPLADIHPANRGKVADNIVSALKGLSEGWGHRAEHILKCLIHGLLHLPKTSLLDVSYALDVKEDPGLALRKQVLRVVDDPLLRRFWSSSLQGYSAADRHPVRHKLGLLLDTPPVSRTFMQVHSTINLARAMQERKVLLVNLSGLGNDIQSTLGSLILSLLQVETLDRAGQDRGKRQAFYVHVDEAYRCRPDAMESILVQCRKYSVGMSFCHQYLRQYAAEQVDALATAGTTIIFNVDASDARRLCLSLQDRVKVEDIVSLPKYEAIVRIDTEIIRIKTRPVDKPKHASCRQEIIERSHQQHYKLATEVLREINRMDRLSDGPFAQPASGVSRKGRGMELEYDEL